MSTWSRAHPSRADERCAKAVQLVEFAKEDVEALWAILGRQAQPASEWTKEQLQTAIESVQNTKHRR
eukprot:8687213-Pyramimonas_sp.AAC.1